jgi:hypothetical protein
VNGWILPTIIEKSSFLPLPDGTFWEASKVRGEVKKLTLESGETGIALASNAAYRVADYRFRSEERLVDSISYPISDGVLKPTTDPGLVEQFAHAVSKAEPDPFVRARFVRTMGIILIGLPILGAAACGFFKLRKAKKAHPSPG